MQYKELLIPYNPWWKNPETSFERLPSFHRPLFNTIYRGLEETPQIISITGPRRVGKSTIIRQIVRRLIDKGIKPDSIVYYSMDDPALYRSEVDHDKFFDSLMNEARKKAGGHSLYVFLDEIQRFERWELFLKKYYDLHYPVRFTISGSASSPIFKKSRESLLGRIKDYHILPFSFREFLLFHSLQKPTLSSQFDEIYKTGEAIMGMLTQHPEYADLPEVKVPPIPQELKSYVDGHIKKFFVEGGFPEVWSLPDWETKQSYLFDNQVEKVISEDLVLAVELRKPELLKRFYISLLENPGYEINFQQLSADLGINRANIEKYFPLLEMTDLIRHAEKFTKSPIRVRRGNIKCYLVDLALRNAILRIQESLLEDPRALGLYAENLVFNALKKWEGTIDINYFREKASEVDFIVHAGAGRYLPVEVKYKNAIKDIELRAIKNFCKRFKCATGIVVTKEWTDFGKKDNLFYMPLPHFLLLFD
ncbi:MAG: ATP-binding protein [Deltaproteobacteria bacterium]|nr:ATP-binding protein [Deltaproteobacteria bacterium]